MLSMSERYVQLRVSLSNPIPKQIRLRLFSIICLSICIYVVLTFRQGLQYTINASDALPAVLHVEDADHLVSDEALISTTPNTTLDEITIPAISESTEIVQLNLLRDVSDLPVDLHADGDIPYFWHIHKSGGSSMKHIFTCLGKVQTRRINEPGLCSDQEPFLRVCNLPFGSEQMGSRIINVDASSFPGIKRATDLGLSTPGNIQGLDEARDTFIVDTSRIWDAIPIFTPNRRARLFTIMRHPVERAISKYFYIKIATWERNYKPEVSNMTLMEYAESKYCYNNWITRRIVHKMQGDLTENDLTFAKRVLKEKTLVLLLDDMEASVERVRRYFGWNEEYLDAEQQNCLKQFIIEDPMNVNQQKEYVEPGGTEWNVIKDKNLYDLELMVFARELYKEQGEMISNMG